MLKITKNTYFSYINYLYVSGIMPITYKISDDGHFIHAVVSGNVTKEEFIDYEKAHASDERIKHPANELLDIKSGSLEEITKDDIVEVFEYHKEIGPNKLSHRCAIVVTLSDNHSWDLAKFYEAMSELHYPSSVIVFGDMNIALKWLGVVKGLY